ncbi:MAG: rRNA maturation RNase YbeY [Rhodobiaceae bacterium]|jgi:probable rRNA maturation factor|nr:rRNA maturation RNase YbeY [Rhodobiaceae bacterium]|tara:strand:- start:8426 stop:8890 length:465 start_codon:yes stop_codon:yes gene_type:complete
MIISNKKLKVEFFKEPEYVKERRTELENILQEFTSFFSLEKVNIEASFCTSKEIQKINKQFRGKDKATNVLSFPDKELTKVSNTCIGEILICNDVLEKESKEQNKNMFDHFVHLTVHSMLHMVGYGHDVANNAILMENKEVKFLSKIGISDPYK